METFWFILPYAGILAAIGLIESLMTLNLIDELTTLEEIPIVSVWLRRCQYHHGIVWRDGWLCHDWTVNHQY